MNINIFRYVTNAIDVTAVESSYPANIAVCPHWDEVFGSESITQVYGSIIEYYGNLPQNSRSKIRIWFFDGKL